ncbi:DUF3788 domain-containing protein [candidate division WOR-3 bacterium]|nr:DUF3788 domain-containing protein [candidate division WOR-3 bacterium]
MRKYDRLSNKELVPNIKKIKQTIGNDVSLFWDDIWNYIKDAYEINPELMFYGKKYGWCYRFRKSSRTLCTIFPEYGSFTILITLGKKEIDKLNFENLSEYIKNIFYNTPQLHDGRWLWIRVLKADIISDIKLLLKSKRKPKI